MHTEKHRCVLVDRDGVINRRIEGGYVRSWKEFAFQPRAVEALRLFAKHKFTVLVVSNQSAVGRGLLNTNHLEILTQRFCHEVARRGGNIGRVYYCTHKPADHCNCRKPKPGLLLRALAEHGMAARDTWMIGDALSDMEAAAQAGCRGILVGNEVRTPLDAGAICPEVILGSLFEAAEYVIEKECAAGPLNAQKRITVANQVRAVVGARSAGNA